MTSRFQGLQQAVRSWFEEGLEGPAAEPPSAPVDRSQVTIITVTAEQGTCQYEFDRYPKAVRSYRCRTPIPGLPTQLHLFGFVWVIDPHFKGEVDLRVLLQNYCDAMLANQLAVASCQDDAAMAAYRAAEQAKTVILEIQYA